MQSRHIWFDGAQRRGRRADPRCNIAIHFERLFLEGEVAWIQGHREIGTTALLVGPIDVCINALLEVHARGRYEMAARRESQDAPTL